MMTIRDFAEKRGVTIQTVYSWIYRNQMEKFDFTVYQFGKVKLVEEGFKRELRMPQRKKKVV